MAVSRGGGANEGQLIMGLGFAGLLLAGAFIFSARALVHSQVLEPACTAACAASGLEMAGMSSSGASVKSHWKSPNRCLCRAEDLTQAPPTCRGSSSLNFECDAGFWFGGGRWLLSGVVNGLFVLGLMLPWLTWGLVLAVRRRRR